MSTDTIETDAPLVDAARKLNRMIEKFEALPPLDDADASDERMQGEHERWFAVQRFIADTPAQGLTGCVVKLRELVLSPHGPIDIGDADTRDIEAFRRIVEVIERINTPPAIGADAAVIAASQEALRLRREMETEDDDAGTELMIQAQQTAAVVWATPVSTLEGAASVVRCLIDRVIGIDDILEETDYQAYVKGLAHVLAVLERAITPPPDNADAALFGVEQRIADWRTERAKIPLSEDIDDPDEAEAAEKEDFRFYTLIADLDDKVLGTPVQTLVGAVCLLRRLLDPDTGVDAEGNRGGDLYRVATRHVLAVVERAVMPPQDGADTALIDAEREVREVDKALFAEAKANPDRDFDQNPSYAHHEALEKLIAETPAKTIRGALAKLRRVLDPDFGLPVCVSDNMVPDKQVPALRQILETLEGVAGQTGSQAAEPSEDDAALIAAEREFYASVAMTEQWSADNPGKGSLDDNPEWERCQELYDDVLALVPAGAVGVAAILRVLLYREWCSPGGSPDNLDDILAHALRVIDRGARITPQPEGTGDDALLILLGAAHKQLVADRKVLGEAIDKAQAVGDDAEVARVEAEDLKAYDRAWEIIDEIASMPAIGYAGLAVKLSIVLDYEHVADADKSVLEMLRSVRADVIRREAMAPPQPDPILELWAEREKAIDAIRRDDEEFTAAADDKYGCDADKKTDKLVDRQIDIELRIAKTSGCSTVGALAKLRIIVQSWREAKNDPEIPAWDKMDRDDRLIVSAMHDLECVTGERLEGGTS